MSRRCKYDDITTKWKFHQRGKTLCLAGFFSTVPQSPIHGVNSFGTMSPTEACEWLTDLWISCVA